MMRPPIGVLVASALFATIASTSGAAGAAKPPRPVDYVPGVEWRRATPASQRIDGARIESLLERLRSGEIPDIDGLVIVRNGYLVVEESFNGADGALPHTLQSVSKSVTSLLVGAALQQGHLAGVDQRVLDFFPEYQPVAALDERKEAMTLRDLLTMRSGFDWREDPYLGSPLARLNACRCDWLRLVLDWPMAEQPGARWEYNSGGTILLAGVLRAVTGMAVDDFAREALLAPLGIDDAWWYQGQPPGLVHAGGGLNLRPQDMARIGYLVLRKGRWGSQRIVSEPWLRDSLLPWTRGVRHWGGQSLDYGYQWWLLPLPRQQVRRNQPAAIYTAAGAMDQWIFVVPRFDLVVVVTGSTAHTWAQPIEFLYDSILPAMR